MLNYFCMDQQSLLEKILDTTTSNREAIKGLEVAVGSVRTDVGSLKTDVSSLKEDMAGVKTDVGSLKTDVGSLKEDMSGVKTDVSSLREDMAGVQETVEFVKDNAVVKADVEQIISGAKSEIVTQIDGFINLHNKLETELVALQSKYERLESQLQQIAQHIQLELR
ncbi:MAG: hypothetical protein ABIH67_04780 [Candidatus Uhrbacteria bacterium]